MRSPAFGLIACAIAACAGMKLASAQPAPAGPIDPYPVVMQLPVGGSTPPGTTPRDAQNVPGVPEIQSDQDRTSDPVPEYVYDPEYYQGPAFSAHQLPDYAPPGYETRDYQSAPGAPEYTPISPPVRVTQAEREKFVVGGIMPGSFLAPGTNTSFRFRGFARLSALSSPIRSPCRRLRARTST
jgi:hypothetical protein